MGDRLTVSPGAARLAAALAVAAFAGAPRAAADPERDLPRPSRLAWVDDTTQAHQSLTLEFAAVAVLGASRLTGYPEVGKLFGGEPEVLRLRLGGTGDFGRFGYAVRVDVAETLRIGGDDFRFFPIASINRVIDDLYGLVRLSPGLRVTAGRQRIGVSRFRAEETALVATGAAPFLIDRLIPERRWGARARLRHGRLGAGAGIWLDGDRFETRTAPGDPGFGASALASAELDFVIRGDPAAHWLPAPPQRGDDDDEPAEAAPARVIVRAAPLLRLGDSSRLDAVVGAELSVNRYGALVELTTSTTGDGVDIGAALEAGAVIHSKAAVFVRAEIDGERRLWSSGAGITYFATPDRRSRVAFYGWIRREIDNAPARDGVVIELQASL